MTRHKKVTPKRYPMPRTVAAALVIKADDIYFLSGKTGQVPPGNQDGFGLYYHDCRYLNGYVIELADTRPNGLASSTERGSVAQFQLTNNEIEAGDGGSVPAQTFGIALQRTLDGEQLIVHDVFTIDNYGVQARELPLAFKFQSEFDDIFEIRGLNPKKKGRKRKPQWRDGVLILSYAGADEVFRRLEIHFEPEPQKRSGPGALYRLKLQAGERRQIKFCFRVVESRKKPGAPTPLKSNAERVAAAIEQRSREWLSQSAEVRSNSAALNAVIRRSLLDLGILKSSLDGHTFFSAGLPWYGALFGRDSIMSALQTLPYEPRVAEQTIRLLAKYQGTKTDDWRDEEPGKILHELRRGELANLNEIPQTPYYGSVDSTPLFLMLLGDHANWTGDLNLFQEMRQPIERALRWIDDYGCAGGKYLSYSTKSRKGLGNQGWKDSGDSIMNADGSLATPPISLVEVQGYVYRAKLLMAGLYARAGENHTAAKLQNAAAQLKEDFNRDFWLDNKKFYALALQKGGRPAAVVSSNPGQALWTGIVDESRAADVAHHLMSTDMFSGWGIRTLSRQEHRYNPVGYHLGTVWPHDNAIIAAGLLRYGFAHEAERVFQGIVDSSRYFDHQRMPEVFSGFSRQHFSTPVRYPVACHPQAWAAGSVPFMVSSLLGLTGDAFNSRLRVLCPVLPHSVKELEINRVKIGNSQLDLHFHRASGGQVQVEVRNNPANIKVELEQQHRLEAA